MLFAKGIILLDRFIKFDEPFSNRAGHAENTAAQAGHFSKKRTNRSQNRTDRLLANIKYGKQSLESIFSDFQKPCH